MQRILILGTNKFAPELADVVSASPEFEVVGFVENKNRQHATHFNGLPVHWIDEIKPLTADHWGLCALATPARDGFIQQAELHGLRFATFVHPTAVVSATTRLGEGTIISTRAVVASHTTIGCHVRVNRGALIGHHAVIDDFVTIQPGANVGGCSHIGSGATVSMGAIVLDRVSIGEDAIVGAGAVVTKDVPPGVQVLGVPAKVTKAVERQRRAA